MNRQKINHKQLITVAKIANGLSWLFLVLTIFNGLNSILVFEPDPELRNGLIELIFGSLAGNYYTMRLILSAINQFLDVFIIFLVLRAISLALRILVNIDSTYNTLKQGAEDE